MSRLLQNARYGAVKPNEITAQLAPPAIVAATEILAKAVAARVEAEAAWLKAEDELDYERETLVERVARATVTGDKIPVDQTGAVAESDDPLGWPHLRPWGGTWV
jgi:hypothetical protein